MIPAYKLKKLIPNYSGNDDEQVLIDRDELKQLCIKAGASFDDLTRKQSSEELRKHDKQLKEQYIMNWTKFKLKKSDIKDLENYLKELDKLIDE